MFIHCHISHHTTNNNVEVNGGGGLMGDHRCLCGSFATDAPCGGLPVLWSIVLGSRGEAGVPDPQVFATLTTAPVAASTSTTAVSNSIGGCPGNRPFKTTRQTE